MSFAFVGTIVLADPRDPLLRTHKLKGELADCWASSVDHDLRAIFRLEGEEVSLVNLGSHNEVS